jgi:hypothetical protein
VIDTYHRENAKPISMAMKSLTFEFAGLPSVTLERGEYRWVLTCEGKKTEMTFEANLVDLEWAASDLAAEVKHERIHGPRQYPEVSDWDRWGRLD